MSSWLLFLCHLQKFNADFDLSAREGADSLAFISLMEEKLAPALVRQQHRCPLGVATYPGWFDSSLTLPVGVWLVYVCHLDLRLLGGAKELHRHNALLVCRAPTLPLQLLPAWPDAAPPAGQAAAAARGRQLGGQRGSGEGGDTTIGIIITFAQNRSQCRQRVSRLGFFFFQANFFFNPTFYFFSLFQPSEGRGGKTFQKVNMSQEDRSA